MENSKQLLPSLNSVNAKNISLFVSAELSGKQNIIAPEKADNVFDFSAKFDQERNSSSKFCFYGMVESKWSDCTNLKIEFEIKDSSTNPIPSNEKFPFWVYDKESNVSAYTWSLFTNKLAGEESNLSKNLYGKKKAQYFFPFELDLNTITNTNKSLYVLINDIQKGLFLEKEIPFLFYDEDNLPLEYGLETAFFLDNGEILEINNNYPFFYDRHWIRDEFEPTGPPFVYFEEPIITIKEGDNDPRVSIDKILNVPISLSKKPRGIEKVKIEVLYGFDKDGNKYTTVTRPQDLQMSTGYVEWESTSANTTQNLKINLLDDFYVEQNERLTLKITPILGVLPHPENAQVCSIYISDNDVPSKVAFSTQSTQIIEPRGNTTYLKIPINLVLDQTVLVPDQKLTLFIDPTLSDCDSTYGFLGYRPGENLRMDKEIEIDQQNVEFTELLYFMSTKTYDIQRKIVIKMSGLTSNLVQQSFVLGQSPDYTIFVEKNLDDNFVEIRIPHNPTAGVGVLRALENPTYISTISNTSVSINAYIARLKSFQSSIFQIFPNRQITGTTTVQIDPTQVPYYYKNSLVYEDSFTLKIKNISNNQIIFDNQIILPNDTYDIHIISGFTTNQSVYYTGSEFVLKLPANTNFRGEDILPNNPLNEFRVWGFTKCLYSLAIRNNSANWFSNNIQTNDPWKDKNYTTSVINSSFLDSSTLQYQLNNEFSAVAGNNTNKKIYYLASRIQNCLSQIKFKDSSQGYQPEEYDFGNLEIESYENNNLYLTDKFLYYPSAVILPRYSSTQKTWTRSEIFLTQDTVVLENQYRVVTGTSAGNQYGSTYSIFNYPISNFTLQKPIFPYQKVIRYDFGPLFVQAGRTIVNQQIDSFMMATTTFYRAGITIGNTGIDAANWFLYKWDVANPQTKRQAVIEIVNRGSVAAPILGTMVNPNEKVWISELPLQLPSETSGIYNIVVPFQLLNNVEFFTNYKFVKEEMYQTNSGSFNINKVNAFKKAKYDISFLNFQLYNLDGTPSNTTFNYTFPINLDIKIQNSVIFGGQVNFLSTKYFLWTSFSPGVAVNGSSQTGKIICDNQILRLIPTNLPCYTRGMIAIANTTLILGVYSLDTDSPVFLSTQKTCERNGIKFYYFDN